MELVKDRLKKFLKYKNITASAFEKKIGAANGYVSGMINTIGPKYLDIILTSYPDLNRNWLLYGEGEMLKPDKPHVPEEQPDMALLVPIGAMGGDLMGFDPEGVLPEDCERIPSPIRGIRLAFPVIGDSMVPDYPSGSTVFVKKIDPSYIPWGQVFVLDTTNGVLIKEIQPSDKEGYLTCVSHNPSGRYKAFDIPKSAIRAMYRVVASMALR